ncbi:murein L,D-transpeptidase [Candidatus Saccharibacteria bacterium]|nr:murein L,D-transpeptidase [Candidatus Saccharibacteria bacterium]
MIKKGEIVKLYNNRGKMAERNPYKWGTAGWNLMENRQRHPLLFLEIVGVLFLIAVVIVMFTIICNVSPARAEEYVEENWVAEVTGELLYDCPENDPETVKAIQTELNRYLVKHLKGYKQLTVDGVFGPATATAVKDYQRLKKMSVDGIVGPATADIMEVEIEDNIYYAPCLADAFARSRNGVAAHLNLNSHLLEIYNFRQDGWELVKVMKCSTGNQKKGYYTPVGTFVLDGTSHHKISGEGWEAMNATKITYVKGKGTFLFHSVLKNPRTGKFDSDSTLGKSITHGCVRLSRDDAKWVRKNLTAGTVVVIDDRSWNNSAIVNN